MYSWKCLSSEGQEFVAVMQGGSFPCLTPPPSNPPPGDIIGIQGNRAVFYLRWENTACASDASGSADKASAALSICGGTMTAPEGLLGPYWPFEFFASPYSRKAICRVEMFLTVD